MSRENPTEQGGDLRKNWETSTKEVENFKAGKHGNNSYFAYFQETKENCEDELIVTWMGDLIAWVVQRFPAYKVPVFGGFPSLRQNFRAEGIDGHMYSGTYYVSSGNYVRMKRVKKGKE